MRIRCVVAAAVVVASPLHAQLAQRAAVAPMRSREVDAPREPAVRMRVGGASRASNATASPRESRRWHVVRGALIGAGIGLVAGAIGGTYVGIGCDASTSSCSETRERIGVMAWFGAEGAVAGALLGGAIGAMLPVGKASVPRTVAP